MKAHRFLVPTLLALALQGAWAQAPAVAPVAAPASPSAASASSASTPPTPPTPPTLADQLNRQLDRIFKRSNARQSESPSVVDVPGSSATASSDAAEATKAARTRAPAPPSPYKGNTLGDQLNRQLDRLLTLRWDEAAIALVEDVPAMAQKAAQTTLGAANAAALAGPVINPDPVLKPVEAPTSTLSGLTLLQAWRQALANDAQLRAARAAQAAGRERLPQARAQMLPSVQYSASRFQNSVDRTGVNGLNQPLNTFDRYGSENQTLQLRQPLVRAQLLAQLDQARSVVDEVEATFQREQQAMSVRVATAYFEALLARDQLELVLNQQRFLSTAVDAETKAFKAGSGTRTAVDEAQARLDLNKAQELEARQAEAQARRQLQSYLQQPVGTLAKLRDQALELQVLARGDLEEWTSRALSQSPEIKALQAQIEQARTEINKTRAAHLPTLDFIAQAQRSRSENIISPQSQYESRGVGLQLNVPIYGGGFVNSATRQAAAEHERAREQLQALREDLSVRVHREYRGVTEGQARIRGLEVALRSANVALDSARRSQIAGLRTALDVLNAEQQRQQVLRDLAQSRYQVLAAAVRLHALSGSAEEGTIALVDSTLEP